MQKEKKGKEKKPQNYKIKSLSLFDAIKAKKLYDKSSKELKRFFSPMFFTFFPLRLVFYLSATPLKFLLPLRINCKGLFVNNKLAGLAYIDERRHLFKKNTCYFGIVVFEGYQSLGLGKKLMQETLKGTKEVMLTVDAKNTRAINLYKKLGFVEKKTEVLMVKKYGDKE